MAEAYNVVRQFEKEIAKFAGSQYAVSVSSCTNAIFLCLRFIDKLSQISIPKRTYPGVACSILHAGYNLAFDRRRWRGAYDLTPYPVWDSALRFKKGMYIKNSFYCLSFHIRKHIPIGRGGMILTDSQKAYEWLKKARFDGRGEKALKYDDIELPGYNMYMTPEQAARGLALFGALKTDNPDDLKDTYPDISKWRAFR